MATTQSNPGKGKGKNTVVVAAKHSKSHRKAPEQYAPKAKAPVVETVQTDPMGIWNGYLGKHEVSGMIFETVKRTDSKDREFRATSVVNAPEGTALHGMAGSTVYVTTGQIHAHEIKLSFPEGHSSRVRQQRLWDFFNWFYRGAKEAQAPKPAEAETAPETNVSASVASFNLATPGQYCFDDQAAPRAVFGVEMVFCRNGGQAETVANITLVSVDAGHQLHGKVKSGMKLFHRILARQEPGFKGCDAGERYMMWEHLTDIVAEHKALRVPYSGQS